MPRSAVETPLTESPSPALNDLLKRGRAHGRLSLDEVRGAFETAGISPAQGRSILRELSEAGISLAGEPDAVRKRAAAADHAGGETAQDTSGAAGAARKRTARRGAAKTTAKAAGAAPRPAALPVSELVLADPDARRLELVGGLSARMLAR
ncbi:RNA polymerase sigma factor region1.1 domain-containing protein, partial [Actinomadura sp. NPDC048032]|uniref:RNA polymerase sigma factor region1.1 domain-containing protein n=1 Tax=Actinomadura sp. NPDC048032 TaxID=3155747 RepID=UPI0033DB5983